MSPEIRYTRLPNRLIRSECYRHYGLPGQRGAGQDLADQSRNGFKKTLKIEQLTQTVKILAIERHWWNRSFYIETEKLCVVSYLFSTNPVSGYTLDLT